jgi:hypothetical protein
MDKGRRWFVAKLVAVAAAAGTAMKSVTAWAKGLPSDPGGEAKPGPDVMVLPGFEKNGTLPLEQALLKRKTDRGFTGAAITPDKLSRLLWAADGMNRDDGHRTAPSAVAQYAVDVYAALPEGVYRYDVKKHALVKVLAQDIRREVPSVQGELKKASLTILYVINTSLLEKGETNWSDLEIGCMVQNVYLEAAQLGLGSCVFALVSYNKVSQLLGLKKSQTLRIAQAVGPIG